MYSNINFEEFVNAGQWQGVGSLNSSGVLTGIFERVFHLTENKTNIRSEVLGGVTTFISMAYVILVNSNLMAEIGMPRESAIAATIWSSAIATGLMGLYANFPVALAPGLGLVVYFAYSVVGKMGLSWQAALGAVFISGSIFLVLTICGIRQTIVRAIPVNLKRSMGAGMGLFIAFIGFRDAGIIAADPSTIVTFGNIANINTLLALLGFVFMAVCLDRKFNGGILCGICLVTFIGMLCGLVPVPHSVAEVITFKIPSMAGTFGQMDISGAFEFGLVSIIFSFTMVDLFETLGTLVGVTSKAGMVDENGDIKNLDRALTVDSVGTMIGATLGTPTITSYVESATGVAVGGRTGLTAVVTAGCFLLTLFFTPLVSLVPKFATAPALIIVGALMLEGLKEIEIDDYSEGIPVFLTVTLMALTMSIATGFAFGFISYCMLKTFSGKAGEIRIEMWLITLAFLINLFMRS